MSACALCLGAQRLVAFISKGERRLHRHIRAAPTPEACTALFDWLFARDVRNHVISQRSPTLIAQAQAAHRHVARAPHQWIEPETECRWQRSTYPAIARQVKAEGAEIFVWDESGFRDDPVHGMPWGRSASASATERSMTNCSWICSGR